jgi:hypothetical protein
MATQFLAVIWGGLLIRIRRLALAIDVNGPSALAWSAALTWPSVQPSR